MSLNKLALIRYKTIDNCLRNRYRKWTLEDLIESVDEALYEFEGIKKGVSKRTIQLDLQNMRSEKLGYNAPIIVVDKKYYTYEDKKFSITNTPLNKQDLDTLTEVVGILQQFSAFGYLNEIKGMISKLQDKIHTQKFPSKPYIHYEKNELLKGLEWIEPIHKAIIESSALLLKYQSFKAKNPQTFVFYPYILKEYRNRWFILGKIKNAKSIILFALDRIQDVQVAEGEKYKQAEGIDIHTYFDDLIGVSKTEHLKPHTIVLKIGAAEAPYILTKPLHTSQKILKETEEYMIFSIEVVWNFELEREILGFGESMTVLSPKRLVNKIRNRAIALQKNYENKSPNT